MENLIVIKTTTDPRLKELKEYIKAHDFIAFDVETNGTDKEAKIIGFSFSADYETGYYVVTAAWDNEKSELVELETNQMAKEILSWAFGKNLVMHNGNFDCWMVQNNYGIDYLPYFHTDTMIAGHLLNENRLNGLKELATAIFGEDSKAEQEEMKASVKANGGSLTKDNYELYKADADLIGRYGAKDTILTIKLFYLFAEQLIEEKLEKFYYDDESMPLLKGPTYELNTVGLKIDVQKLEKLKGELEAECLEAQAFIHKEITPLVAKEYPGTNKKNTFNMGSGKQLAWLLFVKLGNDFSTLTDAGKELCKALSLKLPYSPKAKVEFLQAVRANKGRIYEQAKFNPKTKKMSRPKKVGDVWHYLASDSDTLKLYSNKYKWVQKLLELNKNKKILDTYVIGIQKRMKYGIIRPSFLQHGTTSGRYSSKNPNFQNLPRGDKRVKSCIVSRPGKVFVGADYSQLEPRVFASTAQDETLMASFASGDDFYSVVGAPIFDKNGLSMKKSEEGSFASKYPELRDKAKVVALATPYGRTPGFMASEMDISREEARDLMDKYFEAYPKVELMMLESHEMAKKNGVVHNLFGRPRRIPEAMKIPKIYGNLPHGELPYEARTLLNLAMNHRVQSTGASIMNRAAIMVYNTIRELALTEPLFKEVNIVLQVHDEVILEGPEAISKEMVDILKYCMENAVKLPGVELIAEPKVANNIADLK